MKIKIIPFDARIAKDIQDGKIKGKILNNLKEEVRIVCFDREDAIAPIIALFKTSGGEGVMYVRNDGCATNCRDTLVLEISNGLQFKPFDKVLVRSYDDDRWTATLYSHYNKDTSTYECGGLKYKDCIPYEGNEHLVGTTDKPKEE